MVKKRATLFSFLNKRILRAKVVRGAVNSSVIVSEAAGLGSMMDSDSDLDEFSKAEGDKRQGADDHQGRFYQFNLPERIFQSWKELPDNVKYDATHRMKIEIFWKPVVLQRDEHSPSFHWALEIDLIDKKEDLTIECLKKVEVLEAILRAMDRGILDLENAKAVVWIREMFSLGHSEIYERSVRFLHDGDPDIGRRIKIFGNKQTCLKVLEFIFVRYCDYVKAMVADATMTLSGLMSVTSPYHLTKSEVMKERGNQFFEKQQYKEAIKFYTEAIDSYPDNYLIYGNRALCYIRRQKYLKAVGDGKRAILLEPFWPKGHYRYCEALFSMGEVEMAIYNNRLAIHYCQGSKNSVRDLEQQLQKFYSVLTAFKVEKPMTAPKKREPPAEPGSVNDKAPKKAAAAAHKDSAATNAAPQNKVSQNKTGKKTKFLGKNEKMVPEESSSKAPEPTASETSSKTQQMGADVGHAGSSSGTKKKAEIGAGSQKERQKRELDKARLGEELSCLVQDAHTALTDLRSANAERAFRRALALVETATPKDLGLSTQDELLLLYGHASALTDVGQPEGLAEAQRVLEKMKSFGERKFQCLVFYGMGRVFVRENRFAAALEPLLDSLQMVRNHIMPGKLTWPFSREVVKETQPNSLKAALEDAIDGCRFPPPPNAVCRSEKCLGKAEIYFTDPDFKGFIRICCCQSCVVEYHTACWKACKATSFCKKNEKEFLQGPCLTPDCVGQICSIQIFDPTGLAKHKFEEPVPKAQRQKKLKVNQKCSSLKKLKSKEERRIRRKQHQQERRQTQISDSEALAQREDSARQPPQKAWLLYRDRVLLQISQNMELLREERSLQVATLASALRPWLTLDSMKNNQLAVKLLSWEEQRLETVGQFAEVLLERKNRVWARVFIHVLSSCGDVNAALSSWARCLNDAGLKAAEGFLQRYSRALEQLDLTVLLSFEPLQEMFLEKLGSRAEVLASIGLSVTEYLTQAPAHDTRLFIWALEEHRDQYEPFHSILDHYFDMMDGHCSIIQKSNDNKNNSPLKSRVRKKKQKESKAVFPLQGALLCGRGGLTSREEWDHDFLEDESLSFLHSSDPFRVPSHIQEQVAEFELQYNSSRHGGQNNFLDNDPDPTTESLYDYFAQILEEHGPLAPEDPLLVGQLDDFPPVAQQSIRESGGLQTFLLRSVRFIRTGSRMGLAKHAVSLDQLDHLEYPNATPTFPNPHARAFISDPRVTVSATGDVYPVLPVPPSYYYYPPAAFPHAACPFAGAAVSESAPSFEWANGDAAQLPSYCLADDEEELDLYSSEAVVGGLEDGPAPSATAAEENVWWKHAAVQVSQEMRSVAVNTELHERFEKHLGDVNKMQKSIWSMEEKIEQLWSGGEQDHVEDLTELKEEIQKITANIQVTNTELSLFQRKLEDEVKQDQKEKKANQEVLKSLKVDKERLIEEQQSLARKLKETKATYDTVFRDFLELSNQSAAERRSLEDEIQRCEASLSSATRRSLSAQTLHQEMNQGGRGSIQLPALATNSLAEAPPPCGAEAGPASAREQRRPPDTMLDRVLEKLAAIFPGYTRSYLKKCVGEFLSSSGGTLSSVPLEDTVGGVTQLILENQGDETSTARSTPPPPPVWQKPEARRTAPKQALNVEDPCIICHEDMAPDEMCVLECRHSFHEHCIKPWLKSNNTCPTCRVHTLLPEDFPELCNKRRQAP